MEKEALFGSFEGRFKNDFFLEKEHISTWQVANGRLPLEALKNNFFLEKEHISTWQVANGRGGLAEPFNLNFPGPQKNITVRRRQPVFLTVVRLPLEALKNDFVLEISTWKGSGFLGTHSLPQVHLPRLPRDFHEKAPSGFPCRFLKVLFFCGGKAFSGAWLTRRYFWRV